MQKISRSKKWFSAPNMQWHQQLNFGLWYATTGCGVSREIIDDELQMPPQILSFYRFHV